MEYHLLIANDPEKVIVEIKNKNCILNETIKPCPDINSLSDFATYHYWSNSESVNVFQVIGTAHPDYNNGISWIDMLRVGKRNLSLLATNPSYYYEQTKKEPVMHYARINDEIYISGEGNHRTAIAKVLFFYTGNTVLHGIEFEEYRIDFNLMKQYHELKDLLFKKYPHVEIEVAKRIIKREDTSGWKKDYYEILFKFINHKKGKQFEVKSNKIDDLYKELCQSNWIKKLLRKDRIVNFF